jgi:hypothetical protein
MSRTTSILLIVLGVVIIGGGAYMYLNWGQVSELINPNANTKNTSVKNSNSKSNSNSVVVTNLSLPTEVKGDTVFSGTMTVANVKLTLSSIQWTNQYADLTAGTDNSLLMIYIDPVPSADVASVASGLTTNMQVVYTGGSVKLRRYKVAGGEIKNDRGYMLFEVPTTATDIFVVNGTSATAERVAVPAPK